MNWLKCTKCDLHKYRRHVVMGRGLKPAKILFIGEAPGKSENLRGEPFIGPSGKLLTLAMERAAKIAKMNAVPSYYITNVVGCRPTDEINGPNRQPTEDEAWSCWPRLEEIYAEVSPRRVVFIGKVAEKFCKAAFPDGIPLVHPAYILRKGGTNSTEYRAFVRSLSMIFKSVKLKKRNV